MSGERDKRLRGEEVAIVEFLQPLRLYNRVMNTCLKLLPPLLIHLVQYYSLKHTDSYTSTHRER